MIVAYGFDSRCKWITEEKSQTVTSNGGGGSYAYLIMTYQNTVGTISPGAHPGSYNGQDAYNDMLVTDDGTIMHGNRTGERRNNAGGVSNLDR